MNLHLIFFFFPSLSHFIECGHLKYLILCRLLKETWKQWRKKKSVSKYHYNWSSRSPEIVVIELHPEHTDCHDCILSSVCDQKIKKSQNYKPLSRRTRTLYVNCWPYVTALRRFNTYHRDVEVLGFSIRAILRWLHQKERKV